MGFLDNVRKSMIQEHPKNWKELKSLDDLQEAIKASNDTTVVLFKHSIRCGTSSAVKESFEGNWNLSVEYAQVYYLDLINHRDISNAIAERLGVVHQSPQVIALQDEKVIYSKTHHSIDAGMLMNLIRPM